MTLRTQQCMYYGQRDWRGRAEVYRDLGDGTGPCRLHFLEREGQKLLPDWGKRCDIGRRQMLAEALLGDALGDYTWAKQISWEFGEKLIDKLPQAKWKMSAALIHHVVSALELGVKIDMPNLRP